MPRQCIYNGHAGLYKAACKHCKDNHSGVIYCVFGVIYCFFVCFLCLSILLCVGSLCAVRPYLSVRVPSHSDSVYGSLWFFFSCFLSISLCPGPPQSFVFVNVVVMLTIILCFLFADVLCLFFACCLLLSLHVCSLSCCLSMVMAMSLSSMSGLGSCSIAASYLVIVCGLSARLSSILMFCVGLFISGLQICPIVSTCFCGSSVCLIVSITSHLISTSACSEWSGLDPSIGDFSLSPVTLPMSISVCLVLLLL